MKSIVPVYSSQRTPLQPSLQEQTASSPKLPSSQLPKLQFSDLHVTMGSSHVTPATLIVLETLIFEKRLLLPPTQTFIITITIHIHAYIRIIW